MVTRLVPQAVLVVWQVLGRVAEQLNQRAYMAVTCHVLARYKGVRFTGRPLYLAPDITLDVSSEATVEIGDRVVIAQKVLVLTHDFSLDRIVDRRGELPDGQEVVRFGTVSIGDHAFVGARSILMPGVSIGAGSVVAAGAVVTRDVPPDEVWGGNPARRIGSTAEYHDKRIGEHLVQRRRA